MLLPGQVPPLVVGPRREWQLWTPILPIFADIVSWSPGEIGNYGPLNVGLRPRNTNSESGHLPGGGVRDIFRLNSVDESKHFLSQNIFYSPFCSFERFFYFLCLLMFSPDSTSRGTPGPCSPMAGAPGAVENLPPPGHGCSGHKYSRSLIGSKSSDMSSW